MDRKLIWLFLFIGSTIGGLIPLLWSDGALSLSSIVFTGAGGLFGIWFGYKLSQ